MYLGSTLFLKWEVLTHVFIITFYFEISLFRYSIKTSKKVQKICTLEVEVVFRQVHSRFYLITVLYKPMS